jgi:hypothetical protein
VNDDALRRHREASQLLHRPSRRSAVDVVRHLVGVQAQVVSASALAMRARTPGLTTERVRDARNRDRSIVRTWAMRGTLHLVAAEDYGWLIPMVTEPRVANADRRLHQEGVSREHAGRAVRSIERMLEREGPLTRPEIADRLRRRGIRTDGQAIAHLVWLAAASGSICFGPDRGKDETYALVRDWLGEPERMEPDAALAELAVRYLASHAPAEPDDLGSWSGVRLSHVKRGWKSIEDRLVEVATTRGSAWALRSRKNQAGPGGLVRLLPAFDEYLMGWKDRDLVAPAAHRSQINRGGGWLHPVVLADGRAVGTWRTTPTADHVLVQVRPFAELSPAVRRKIREEAADIAAFLGTPIEVSFG